MPVIKINIEELLPLMQRLPVLDVRSPGEYGHAHIPGAVSFPLFTNDERRVIGTAYKQESREKAIKIGLDAFGRNLVKMVEEAEKLVGRGPRELIVHCWRGGMRSSAVAWLLDLYGFKVHLLSGGYKSYRRWALVQFQKQYPIKIVGGYTGSNKTGLIRLLQKQKHFAIDLEALAGHKGSAFGNLLREQQPTQEMFENLLALELYHFSIQDAGRTIWLENESQRIGDINMPLDFFTYFSTQPVYFIDVPFEQRLKHLVDLYGKAPKENLINAIVRITKRLGGLEAKTAINCLMDNDVPGCFGILLKYYDKLYRKNETRLEDLNRPQVFISCDSTNAATNLQKLLEHADNQ